MRIFFTTLIALCLSLFVGGIVAQQLAVHTGATEEYILVFMSLFPLAILFLAVFLVAQIAWNTRSAIDSAAKWTLVNFAVLVVALFGFEYWAVNGDIAMMKRDLPILAGLTLPGLMMIIVDWLYIRWRVSRAPVA